MTRYIYDPAVANTVGVLGVIPVVLGGTGANTADNAAANLGFIKTSAKNQANGVAGLDGDGKVALANLPSSINSATEAAKLTTARNIALSGDVTGSVSFDGSANVSITATGVQAAKLTTARNIALTGDVTGTTSFDGSGNVSITATVADDSHFHTFDNITATPTTLAGYGITDGIPSSSKGAANGVATLDSNGLVPSTQLPSYVDDVLELANLASFPGTGEGDKIYVARDTNKCYRWSGSAYIFITSGAVDSVMGATGVITATDLGLQNFTAGATVSGTHTGSSSGTNTGDQTITLTGDVTGSGTGSFAATLATVTDSGTGSFKKVTTNSKGLVTGTAAVAQADITGLLGAGSISNAMLANGAVANLSGTNTGDETSSTIKTKLGVTTLSGSNTGDQTIALTGDVTGSGTGSFAATLTNSGVTAGTYKSVTVTAKGIVTGGTNPTTLSGYGITDAIPSSSKGAANGVATLDSNGLVPSTQLPSYVDDILEFANLASFPGTGVGDKIYVALDTNKCYRWSGSAYIFITSGAVDSVMGATGVITATDLGLQNFTAGATVSGTHTGSSSGTNTGDETTSTIKTKLGITTLSGTNTGDQTIALTGDVTGSGTGTFAATLATITDNGTGTFKKVTTNSKGLVTGTAAVTQNDITGLLGNGSISNAMLANGAVANLSGTNTGNQTIALTGDVTGSGTGTFAATLATITDSGVGAFKKVTTNSKGLVTGTAAVAQADITGLLGAGSISNAMLANSAVANLSGTNTGDETLSTIKTKLGVTTLSGSNTGDQTITLTGDATGSGTGSFAVTLATITDSGTGTFKKITTNSKGLVTGTTSVAQADITGLLGAGSITNAMLANGAVANLSGTNTGDETTSTIKTKLGVTTLSGSNTGDQTITLTGDVTGSGTGSFAATLTNSGVTAGTYKSVTVTAKGIVTGGTNPTTLAGYGITDAINSSLIGAANGVATLDSNGLVPSTQLPSYVDDVLEFANLASFPGTGTSGKIYVALDTNKCYRWSGSVYTYITSGAVDSVMGSTGVVTATNLGLQNFTAGATVSGTHSGSSSGTNTGDETLATIKSKLGVTTLSGSNTGDQTITLTGDATGSGTGSFAVTLATITNSGTGTFKKVTTNTKGLVTGTAAVAQADITGLLGAGSISNAMLANGAVANLSGTNTGDQTITLTGDATGSGTGSFAVTLANVATAGTYKSVTVNAKGLVTAGTNPTTLAGFGITDAIPSSAKGAVSGVAELDNKGVLKSSHLPFAAMMFLMCPM